MAIGFVAPMVVWVSCSLCPFFQRLLTFCAVLLSCALFVSCSSEPTTPPSAAAAPVERMLVRLVAVIERDGRPTYVTLDGSGMLPPGQVVSVSPSASAAAGSVVSDDPRSGEQWGLAAVGAPAAWKVSSGADGQIPVRVAVVDSGVDGSHEDLVGSVLEGFDAISGGNGWVDDAGHGTHVAGIVVAHRDNATGGSGLAPAAQVLPVRVLNGDGFGDHEDIAEGIVWAVDAGADVINLSLGGPESTPILESAVNYAVANGVVVVAAAGNARLEGNEVSYPAAYDGVIAVAAAAPDGRSAMFSNTGSYVDIAAPGFSIVSTVPGGYLNLSGTSQAAPFVSAASALLLASGVAAGDVERRLERSAGSSPSPAVEVGAGFVDVGNAVAGVVTVRDVTLPGLLPPLPGFGSEPVLSPPMLPPVQVPVLPSAGPSQPDVPVLPGGGAAGGAQLSVPPACWGASVSVRAVSFGDVAGVRGPDGMLVPFGTGRLEGSYVAEVVALPGVVDLVDSSGDVVVSVPMVVSPAVSVTAVRDTRFGERLALSVAPVSPVVVWVEHLERGVWRKVSATVSVDGVGSVDVPAGSYRFVAEAFGLVASVSPPLLAR